MLLINCSLFLNIKKYVEENMCCKKKLKWKRSAIWEPFVNVYSNARKMASWRQWFSSSARRPSFPSFSSRRPRCRSRCHPRLCRDRFFLLSFQKDSTFILFGSTVHWQKTSHMDICQGRGRKSVCEHTEEWQVTNSSKVGGKYRRKKKRKGGKEERKKGGRNIGRMKYRGRG